MGGRDTAPNQPPARKGLVGRRTRIVMDVKRTVTMTIDQFDANTESYCRKIATLERELTATRSELADADREIVRFKAELEAKRLRWQTGTVPETGNYVIDRTDMYAMQFFVRLFQGQNPNCKWAGPIVVEEP